MSIVVLKWPLLILSIWKEVSASVGDSSPFFKRCVQDCKREICERGEGSVFNHNVFGVEISLWSCLENCEYVCQWKTVDAFQKKNWKIPQFKGKWPFIRLFGSQEPASVIFSIINFFVILKMFITFRKNVPKNSPYYYVWHFYSTVSLNCWIWSTVYHFRDNSFTEKMDYMSAFLMVVTSFYTMGLRFLSDNLNIKTFLWTLLCGCLTVNHLAYLYLYYFDYEYNMKLNCAVGGLTVMGWLFWTYTHFPSQNYAWKISAYAILTAFSTSLEVLDFPPIFWIADAHSLWHLSTAFLNVILYKFIIDDCIHLNNIKSEKIQMKTKIK